MFRCSCLVIVLSLCVFGQADVLLSTPSKSFPFPTGLPILEETLAPTIPPTTKGSANDVTESYVPNDATFQPAKGRSDSTPVAPTPQPTDSLASISAQPTNAATDAPSPQPTNAATDAPSPQPTNAVTEAPSPQPTNATTDAPSPQPTNATTDAPSPQPTNATTDAPSPQPTNATTDAPSPQPTNATTDVPSTQPTNATTASPPTPTTPSLHKVGDYVVRASPNSSACLMARMGLQFSYRMGDSFQTINLDPNVTKTTGTCEDASNESALMLVSDKIVVQFVFSNQTSKFFLSTLNFTVVTGSGPNFTAVNTNLSLWEASLGSSYMCKKEQSFNITVSFILNTFELQVQPFGVTNDQFSTAHECSVDDTSLLIPIIVGAALAVLILIVVIAYVIGRRKTYVGYQTL